MDRTTTMGGTPPLGGNSNPSPTTQAKVESATHSAHRAVDQVADKATEQVGRLSGTAHNALNSAADVASSATDWALAIPDQAKELQGKITEAACSSIRARPIATVAGALVIGYLLGRLARL